MRARWHRAAHLQRHRRARALLGSEQVRLKRVLLFFGQLIVAVAVVDHVILIKRIGAQRRLGHRLRLVLRLGCCCRRRGRGRCGASAAAKASARIVSATHVTQAHAKAGDAHLGAGKPISAKASEARFAAATASCAACATSMGDSSSSLSSMSMTSSSMSSKSLSSSSSLSSFVALAAAAAAFFFFLGLRFWRSSRSLAHSTISFAVLPCSRSGRRKTVSRTSSLP